MGYFGVSVSGQIMTFLYAMALGGILGAIYDIFRILRVAFGGKTVAVFAEDLAFSLIALIMTFVFVIAFNNGELRFFVLLGELAGFTAYYLTVGRLVIGFSKAIINFLKRAFQLLIRPFVKFCSAIKGKIKQKKEKRRKKEKKPSKKHLKVDKKV